MKLKTITLCASALLFVGCSSRDNNVELTELRADNERLSTQLTEMTDQNTVLVTQRDDYKNQLSDAKANVTGLEKQLYAFSKNARSINPIFGPTADGKGVSINQDMAFKKGSSDLTKEMASALVEFSKMLNEDDYKDTMIVVEGHTDKTPVVRPSTKAKFKDNWGLSAMRAAAVISALEKSGIKSTRISGSFKGQHSPIANAKKDSDNRRVEIYLHLPLN